MVKNRNNRVIKTIRIRYGHVNRNIIQCLRELWTGNRSVIDEERDQELNGKSKWRKTDKMVERKRTISENGHENQNWSDPPKQ